MSPIAVAKRFEKCDTHSPGATMTAVVVFKACVDAMRKGTLIERVSATDKEFHFQNWFKGRLEKTGLHFELGSNNLLHSSSKLRPLSSVVAALSTA